MNIQKELIGPVNKSKTVTEQLIFFLHGWGSDGNDLIQISNLWEKEIIKTTFYAPHGPSPCAQNPSGRQWFDILTEDNEKMYKELDHSFSLLDKYIDEQLTKYKLGKEVNSHETASWFRYYG